MIVVLLSSNKSNYVTYVRLLLLAAAVLCTTHLTSSSPLHVATQRT